MSEPSIAELAKDLEERVIGLAHTQGDMEEYVRLTVASAEHQNEQLHHIIETLTRTNKDFLQPDTFTRWVFEFEDRRAEAIDQGTKKGRADFLEDQR